MRPTNSQKALRKTAQAAAIFVAVLMLVSGRPVQAAEEGNIVLASLTTSVPSDRNRTMQGLFGASEERHSDISAFTKWTSVLKNFEKAFSASVNRPEVQDWLKFLSSIKNASPERKIQAVNEYMNKVKFIADTNNYKSRDYWATPMEFLARGGDCEDYAIAKYISLRALGFGKNDMRLTIVHDSVMRMPHAILVVYNEGQAKILDNQNPAVMDSAEISRYKPIYSISQVAWWRH